MIFLDTNIISEVTKPLPDAIVLQWLSANHSALQISTVALGEIAYGVMRIRPSERPKRLLGLVDKLRAEFANRMHPLDEYSAVIYGDLMGKSKILGRTLSPPDGMIAAIALRHKAILATRNTKDFDRLGLSLVNPWPSNAN